MIYSYDAIDKIETFSDEQVIQFYHNAYETFVFALGHSKGQRNEYAKNFYKEELAKRGIKNIPDRKGVFNGIGTS